MDLNLNSAECIKSVANFGKTTYINICNGEEVVVAWGHLYYILVLMSVLVAGIIVVYAIKAFFFD